MLIDSNKNGIAAWKLILMVLTLIVYQNLDNIDGKQARRTGIFDFIKDQAHL